MEKFYIALEKAKKYWWEKLNDDQRKHVSKIFDTLAMGSIAPLFITMVSNDKKGESILIIICIVCGIILEGLAILALSSQKEE